MRENNSEYMDSGMQLILSDNEDTCIQEVYV